jgi:hypothetical protein
MDDRHKLSHLDYQKIMFELSQGNTIRQTANNWGISTKYIGRIVDRVHGTTMANYEMVQVYECSGCGFSFSTSSALSTHQDVWTSGNTHELSCSTVMPR